MYVITLASADTRQYSSSARAMNVKGVLTVNASPSCVCFCRYRDYLQALRRDEVMGEANEVGGGLDVGSGTSVPSIRVWDPGRAMLFYITNVTFQLRRVCRLRRVMFIIWPSVQCCHQLSCTRNVVSTDCPACDLLRFKMAMLDGAAQLWEHSPQWFCLVCKHLLEIGVLSPTSAVHYFFREDNNNAVALSPFLWEVRSMQSCLSDAQVSDAAT